MSFKLPNKIISKNTANDLRTFINSFPKSHGFSVSRVINGKLIQRKKDQENKGIASLVDEVKTILFLQSIDNNIQQKVKLTEKEKHEETVKKQAIARNERAKRRTQKRQPIVIPIIKPVQPILLYEYQIKKVYSEGFGTKLSNPINVVQHANFRGTYDQLIQRLRYVIKDFYDRYVKPLVAGKLTNDMADYYAEFNTLGNVNNRHQLINPEYVQAPSLLALPRGENVICYTSYSPGDKYSCFIDALHYCGYFRYPKYVKEIISAFPNYEDPAAKFNGNEIISFCEKMGGGVHFYDLFGETIYKTDKSKRNDFKVLVGYLNHQHISIIDNDSRKRHLAKTSSQTGRKRIDYDHLLKTPKETTKNIKCVPDINDLLYSIVKESEITQELPEVKFLENTLSRIETKDNIYLSMTQPEYDIVKQINNTNAVDSLSGVITRDFENYTIMNELDIHGQETEEIYNLLNKCNIHAKHYKYNDDQTIFAIDRNKAYSHIFKSIRLFRTHVLSKQNYCLIDNDTEDEIVPGLYNVRTEDNYLFHGNGQYTDSVIKVAIQNNIKFESDWYIDFEAIPTDKTKIFENFVEQTIQKYSHLAPKVAGLLINRLIGCFYRKHLGKSKTVLTFDTFDCAYYIQKYKANIHMHSNDISLKPTEFQDIFERDIQNDRPVYSCTFTDTIPKTKSDRGLYIEVLNNSYIDTYYKMKELGLTNITYIATDAIGLSNTSKLDKTKLNAEIYGDYKQEPIKDNKPEFENKPFLDVPPKPTNNDKWNKYDNISNKSVFITGKAGTGKTTLITNYIKKYDNDKKVILSAQNAPARGINGKTLNAYFNANFTSLSTNQINVLKGIEIMWIDEISMMDRKHWFILDLVKKTCPNIQFILSGDFNQLPPVKDMLDYENSDVFYNIVDGNKIELIKIHRYAFDYTNIKLDNYLNDNIELFKNMQKPRAIVRTNEIRNELNQIALKKIGLTKGEYAIGVPLICKVNKHSTTKSKVEHYNNVRYEVFGVRGERVFIYNFITGKEEEYSIDYLNKNFDYAYAITTYVSQGQTFDFDYVIFEGNIMDSKHLYVAVTRTTDIKKILNASI